MKNLENALFQYLQQDTDCLSFLASGHNPVDPLKALSTTQVVFGKPSIAGAPTETKTGYEINADTGAFTFFAQITIDPEGSFYVQGSWVGAAGESISGATPYTRAFSFCTNSGTLRAV